MNEVQLFNIIVCAALFVGIVMLILKMGAELLLAIQSGKRRSFYEKAIAEASKTDPKEALRLLREWKEKKEKKLA